MSTKRATELNTGEVRISYEHLLKPHAQKPGDPEKYSLTLLIPKTDFITKQNIDRAIQAAIQDGISNKWGGVCPPQPQMPIYDGDGVRQRTGEPYGDECKGHWVMTASSQTRQELVDLSMQPLINASEVYSGMYAYVNINFFAFNKNGNRGIGCGLGPVQKTRDGEPLGGRRVAADAFGSGAQIAPTPAYQPSYQAAPAIPQYAQPPAPQYAAPVTQQYAPPQPALDPITGRPYAGNIYGL